MKLRSSFRILFQKWRFYYSKASSAPCFFFWLNRKLVQYFLIFNRLTYYYFRYFLWNIYFLTFFTFQSIGRYSWSEFDFLEYWSFFLFFYLLVLSLNTSRSLSLIHQPTSISDTINDRLILIFINSHLNWIILLLLNFKVFMLKISENINKINGLVSFW